ncbi:ribosome biogenesis GTPase YlqF [bacterium]|nr:ribosome biogenesis GTPase YlqF [bacterium]
MDMYQKRKIRAEMKNINQEEKLTKVGINWYPGHMAKTKRELKERMNLIDLIYEVIDARMPSSSKIKDIDDILKDKKRILVMTKKDLCDLEQTNKWVDFYKKQGYEVILMDLTNNDDYKKLVKITNDYMKDVQEKRKEKGLKNKEIKIGIIGIPNVGKSTLINKLAGKKVANTGNKPGVTKQINWLKTSSGFLLLDTPGILWPKLSNELEALCLAATASIRPEVLNIEEIGYFLLEFFNDNYPDKIKEKYNIEISDDVYEIFDNLAKRFNFYDNGEINYEKISQRVYNDLVSGVLKGVTFDLWK